MGLLDAVLLALFATGVFLTLLIVFESLRPHAQRDVLTAFGCQAAAYLLALFVVLRRYAPDASIQRFLALRATNAGFYPLGALLGAALAAPANALYGVLERLFPSHEPDSITQMYADAALGKRIVIAVVLIGLGPLLEEVFFRGALFRPLRMNKSAVVVIAATAILFAAAHVDFRMMIPIALVGLALGALRWWSGSLLPSFFAHATFNALGFYAIATSSGSVDAEPALTSTFVVVGTIIAVLLTAIVPWLGRSTAAQQAQREDST
jgi:membrane protease YdiL (CAAX protease family)